MIDESRPDNIVQRIDDLRKEAQSVRQEFEAQWDKNYKLYAGDHWEKAPPEGLRHFVLNRTQNAIVSGVAVQTEARPSVRLTPVETNEPPIIFLREDAGRILTEAAMSGDLLVQGYAAAQLAGQEPITEEQMTALSSMIMQPAAAPQGQAPGGGAPGQPPGDEAMAAAPQRLFGPEDFILINDAVVADAVQRVHDVLWDRSDADFHWVDNILGKAVVGHQDMLVQWDAERKVPQYINLHPKLTWMDPKVNGPRITDAGHFQMDQLLGVSEVIARWPERAEQIKTRAQRRATARATDQVLGRLPYQDIDFGRDMVELTTAWIRYEPFGNEEGSTRYGIRQVTKITDLVLEDIECPYVDIPVIRNVNIPLPFRPYGQGEPERLASLQDAINRLISMLHDHCRYFSSPMAVLPVSVRNALPKGASTHSHPGKTWTVPDELIEIFGAKLKIFIDPPALPASYMEFLGILLAEHDNVSGNSDVMQGRTPSRVESGRAIDLLQSAARGVLSFKSSYTERAVVQATRLVVGMVRDYFDETEWAKYVSDMPPQVLMLMQQRLKNLEFDVRVEIVSGKGTNRRFRQEQAMNEFQAGLRSRPDTMRILEVNDIPRQIEEMVNDPILMAQAAVGQGEGKSEEQ